MNTPSDHLLRTFASVPLGNRVLDLIGRVISAGHDHGAWVGVCGEAGADPLLACVLAGMGRPFSSRANCHCSRGIGWRGP